VVFVNVFPMWWASGACLYLSSVLPWVRLASFQTPLASMLACSTDTADTGSRSLSDQQTEEPSPMDLPAVNDGDVRPTAMVRVSGSSQCVVHGILSLNAYTGAP
jgi:hypothetical protein